jgi:hypothetical protein
MTCGRFWKMSSLLPDGIYVMNMLAGGSARAERLLITR